MASWRQAADAIQAAAAAALAPSQFPSTKVFVGWPNADQLLKDMRDNDVERAMVSIYPAGKSLMTSRYGREEIIVDDHDATETLTFNGLSVEIEGLATVDDNVFLYVNDEAFAVHVDGDDSLASVASELAALISTSSLGVQADAVGTTITLTPNPTLIFSFDGLAVGSATVMEEVMRTTQRFQITVWAPTPQLREDVEAFLTAELNEITFLTFADLSKGRMLFEGVIPSDFEMAAGMLRSIIFFTVEYPIFKKQVCAKVGNLQVTHLRVTLDDGTDTVNVIDIH